MELYFCKLSECFVEKVTFLSNIEWVNKPSLIHAEV